MSVKDAWGTEATPQNDPVATWRVRPGEEGESAEGGTRRKLRVLGDSGRRIAL